MSKINIKELFEFDNLTNTFSNPDVNLDQVFDDTVPEDFIELWKAKNKIVIEFNKTVEGLRKTL